MIGKDHGGFYKAPRTEESEMLRGEGYQIEFLNFRFERGAVVRFMKGRM